MAAENGIVWKKSNHRIYEDFALDFRNAFTAEDKISSASNDLNFAVELQRRRLKSKGLTIQKDISPRIDRPNSYLGTETVFDDLSFYSYEEFCSCKLDYLVRKSGKNIYSERENVNWFEVIFDAKADGNPYEELLICPYCGASDYIKNYVANGCSYCGTVYQAKDFYPKVMNYYYFQDLSMSGQHVKKRFVPKMLFGMILGLFVLLGISSGDMDFVVTYFANAMLYGAGFGFLWFMFPTFIGMLKSIVNSQGLPVRNKSAEIFKEKMQACRDDMKYSYFYGKVFSLIRIIMFSDNVDELPIYVGGALKGQFQNLIDIKFRSDLLIEDISFMDNLVNIKAKAFLTNYYLQDNRIKKVNEVISATFTKNMDHETDFEFSLKGVKCPTCGGTFDASKQKKCSYCGNEIDLADVDWRVSNLIVM